MTRKFDFSMNAPSLGLWLNITIIQLPKAAHCSRFFMTYNTFRKLPGSHNGINRRKLSENYCTSTFLFSFAMPSGSGIASGHKGSTESFKHNLDEQFQNERSYKTSN